MCEGLKTKPVLHLELSTTGNQNSYLFHSASISFPENFVTQMLSSRPRWQQMVAMQRAPKTRLIKERLHTRAIRS